MDNSSANIDLIRSHVDIIILKPLETKDRYGYEILKEIETNSNGLFKLKQPTLYSCLKRLEKQGYINSYLGDESNGAQRRYYALTQQGKDFLESQRAQWEFVRTILSGLVSDVDFDKENDVQPFDPSKYRPLTKRTRSDDEENVKVVEKIVYVPKEEENHELTAEEIKSKLTEDDINDIVKDYLKTHNIETKSVENTQNNENNDDYLSSYNNISSNDEVEEDVALTDDIDDEPYQMSFDDIAKYNESENAQIEPIKSNDNEKVIEELTVTQNNNLDDEENLDNKPETIYRRETITADDLLEDKPKYASYKAPEFNEEVTDSSYDDDFTDFKSIKQEETIHYNTYYDKPIETPKKVEKLDNSNLFDYSSKVEEHHKEKKSEDTVNVFKALDRIYAVDELQDEDSKEVASEEVYEPSRYNTHYNTTTPENNKIETISELKTKLQSEGFKVKPYTKINSSEFYINNYYYANRTARDTSLLMFAIFFIESMLAHFILAPKFNLKFGYLAITWAVAAVVPIFFTIKWAISPYYKKQTRVSLRLSLMLGLIAVLNAALVIFLVGFFGFGADYTNVDTMMLPIIVPLIFLLNIPLYSLMYYVLYKSKRYNLR